MNHRYSTGASTATSTPKQSGSAVSANAQLPPPPSFAAFSGYTKATLREKREELSAWYDTQLNALNDGAIVRDSQLKDWRLAQMPGHIADPAHRSSQLEGHSADEIWERRMKAESMVRTNLITEYRNLSERLTAEYPAEHNMSV